jgi:hypothetical protein
MTNSVMKTALRLGTAVLALGVLAGCGSADDTAAPAEDQTSEQTQEPSESPKETAPETGPVDFTQLALISVSNAEGTMDPQAVVLDSQASVDEFAGQFKGAQMGTALTKAYQKADVPDDEVLVAAVVGVSCQPPSEVHVKQTKNGVRITADAVKTKNQCIVPVTTVAVLSVPESAV